MSAPTPTRVSRSQPRDIVELKALSERQPELAPAATLQVELIEAVRRVQARLSTPWIDIATDALAARLASGKTLLDFEQIAFEWDNVRLLVRQVTDILRRHDAVDGETAAALHDLGRSAAFPDVLRQWFAGGRLAPDVDMLNDVLTWAARPFLERAAHTLQQRVTFDGWGRRTCPICAADADFSVITVSGDRQLVCGRCSAQWLFDPIACPYCGQADRAQITSLATPDGLYRVMVCRPCGRYIKALDARHATRPLLPYTDSIATLPLDAAVMRQSAK